MSVFLSCQCRSKIDRRKCCSHVIASYDSRLIRRVSAFCLIPAQFVDTNRLVRLISRIEFATMTNLRFVFAWILGVTFVYNALPVNAGDAVPVLIWDGETAGSPSISVNPLQKTSQLEFEKIVMKKVGGSQRPVLVFVRDNLCVEDFTQHKEVTYAVQHWVVAAYTV